MKEMDVLSEDPVIPNCRFALISIVGPNMKAKCDVWGLKIRGFVSTTDQGAKMVKRLQSADPNYDIYIVEVGKFFPLAVDPMKVDNIEYQNKELSNLIKNYLENRERANEAFDSRKNSMREMAIKEGLRNKESEEINNEEFPIAVYKRKMDLEEKVKSLEEQLNDTKESMIKYSKKFDNFSEEEKKDAEEKLLKAIKENEDPGLKEKNMSAEEIRKEILKSFNKEEEKEEEDGEEKLSDLLNELRRVDEEIEMEEDEKSLSILVKKRKELNKNLKEFDSEKIRKYLNKDGNSFSHLF